MDGYPHCDRMSSKLFLYEPLDDRNALYTLSVSAGRRWCITMLSRVPFVIEGIQEFVEKNERIPHHFVQ